MEEHHNLNSRQAIFRVGLFALILMLVILPKPLGAQQDAGSLRVLVEDSTGAVVPAAEVKVTNANTNTSSTKNSTAEGYAVFSPIPRGTYIVEVLMSGFRTVRISDVGIDVNQNRLVRAALELAEVTETIEVQADVASIQTEDASLGQVVRGKVIVELPLATRRYTDLALLVPGVTESTLNENSRGPGWLVVNGNNHTQNNFILDGFDNNQGTTNLQSRSAQVVQPSPDTLSEFKVMTNNFSAEFGRAAGAVINASIRSGANDTHGSAWWYNRPSKLAANSWRGNLIGSPKDELTWNQMGGTIGGQIVQDKLFYFGDYEGFFSDTSELQIDDIPTTMFRSGDFSGLTNPIFDPTTGDPFPNNQLPSSRIDPLGQKIIDLYPSPNLPGLVSSSSGRPTDNHGVQLPISNDVHKFDVRIDYYATGKNRFFGRYSFNDSNLFKQPTFPLPADTGSGDGGSQLARNQSLATSWNRVISPTSVNEFRFGYNRTTSSFVHAGVGGVTGTEFGFLGIPPSLDEVGGLPRLVMSSYHNLGTGGWRPQFQDPDAFQINDTFSMTKGAHSMKMGFDFRHKNNEWVDLQYRTTRFSFNREFTDDDAADLLLGMPTDVRGQTFMLAEQIQQNYSAYFQDDWKVTPQLTLNLGMRYEYVTPFWGRSPNTNVNLDLQTGQIIIAPGGQPLLFGAREGRNKFVQDQDFNNFGPRFGVAYQLNSGLVLRGGYGVFFSGEDFHGSGGNLLINGPNTLPITLQREGGGPPPVTLNTPIPADFLDPAAVKTENLGFQFRKPDIEASTVQQWNTALQFLLDNSSTFEIAYVGNKVSNQEATIRANRAPYGVDGSKPENRPYPHLGSVELLEAIAKSQYHAIQAKFEHRFSEGWYNLTSYTYASGLAESGGFAAGNRTQVNLIVDGIPTGDRRRERAFHRQLSRQRLSMANIWQIPYGRGKKWGSDMNPALDAIVGGWQFNTIITGKSGLPVDIMMSDRGVDPITGQSFRFLRNSGGGRLRPDRVGDPNTGIDPKDDRFRFLDANAFALQTIDTPGNAARNTAWGPKSWNFDIGINKRFQITETVHADFRFEMFNTFNHTNFRAPSSNWSRSGFGRINDAFAPRQMQWALRFGF